MDGSELLVHKLRSEHENKTQFICISSAFLCSPQIQLSKQRPEPVGLVTERGQLGAAHTGRRGLFTRLLSAATHRPADHQGSRALSKTQKHKKINTITIH